MLPKVLLVEDYEPLRRAMHQGLKTHFEVLEAVNGEDGYNMITSMMPDLVIADIMMPKMNGYDMISRLKSSDKTKDIPVIFASALQEEEDRIKGLEIGAVDFISKPFNMRELILKSINMTSSISNIRRKSTWRSDVKTYGIAIKDHNKDFVDKVNKIIAANLTNPKLSVHFLVKEMCMTTSTFERYFVRNFNVSAKTYIRDLRLEKAMNMLRGGLTNTADIAYSLGFNSVSYFCKCFKDKFDVTTSQIFKENEDL